MILLPSVLKSLVLAATVAASATDQPARYETCTRCGAAIISEHRHIGEYYIRYALLYGPLKGEDNAGEKDVRRLQ